MRATDVKSEAKNEAKNDASAGMSRRNPAPGEPVMAQAGTSADSGFDGGVAGFAGFAEFDIVLTPLSRPELGDIRIGGDLFAIGRTEPPFAAYPHDAVADLSRRHAKIFAERGAVYLADLGSKNGTTVNGNDARQKTSRLQDGDEICFGGGLCYRVTLRQRTEAPSRAARLLSLTLVPEKAELGLQPIVVTRFPFLISKADAAFARYKDNAPQQVNYLSRRHAHLFLKGGLPFVEDLGSTNGSFVNGERLAEHAVPLRDGDVLAFGGHHFVYRLSLEMEDAEANPTVTRFTPSARGAVTQAAPGPAAAPAPEAPDRDKTTFVEAADSFLDIFCVDPSPQQDDAVDNEQAGRGDAARTPAKKAQGSGKQGPSATVWSELAAVFLGGGEASRRRMLRWTGLAAAVLAVGAAVLYLAGAPERDLTQLIERGDYARAAGIANRRLAADPGNGELKSLSTEALLKAYVPRWLDKLNRRDFRGAADALAAMRKSAANNADAQPLIDELAVTGDLEEFVLGRGGPQAPIRMYMDEDRIKSLLGRWASAEQSHQPAFAAISSHVPAFKDAYAQALSHLRKLRSDEAVYLPAIERLKSVIVTELNQDRPQALEEALQESSEKYPRIGGLDGVRGDLRQYIDLQQAAASGALGALVARMNKVRFTTPPFQDRFKSLVASGRLPPPDIVRQYESVSRAWQAGDAGRAYAALENMAAAGPWAGAAANELARKKRIADQYAELRRTRADSGYPERLLAFYGALDPAEDAWFLRAAGNDLAPYRDKVLRQAQETANRAQLLWARYRENGPITGGQRLESSISGPFRSQAGLLAQAQRDAQQGLRTYMQLKMDYPAQWKKTQDEIDAEAEQQRRALLELRNVLEPGLLKTKLALLGGQSNEERKPSQTAR